jgi:hypothetical protein
MTGRPNLRLAAAAALCLGVGGIHAAAADDPAFSFAAPAKPAEVTWSANAQAGVSITSGNAFGLGFSGSGALARQAGSNRFSAEVSGSFARTRVEIAVDSDGVQGIGPGEVRSVVQTTAAAWAAKLRYDRFFGARHSLYLAASAAGDEPAGKRFLGGGQLGYSRELVRSAAHSLVVEAGYDLSYQDYVASTASVTVHSARLFAAYQWSPSPGATASLGAELLTNVAGEDTPTGHVSPFRDDRIAGRGELSLKLNDRGRLAMRVNAKYDSHPAPKPPPAGTSWAPGYVPLADRLDTRTELLVVYSFL